MADMEISHLYVHKKITRVWDELHKIRCGFYGFKWALGNLPLLRQAGRQLNRPLVPIKNLLPSACSTSKGGGSGQLGNKMSWPNWPLVSFRVTNPLQLFYFSLEVANRPQRLSLKSGLLRRKLEVNLASNSLQAPANNLQIVLFEICSWSVVRSWDSVLLKDASPAQTTMKARHKSTNPCPALLFATTQSGRESSSSTCPCWIIHGEGKITQLQMLMFLPWLWPHEQLQLLQPLLSAAGQVISHPWSPHVPP